MFVYPGSLLSDRPEEPIVPVESLLSPPNITVLRDKNVRPPRVLTEVEISGIAAEGKAIAKTEGKVVFVPYAAPGDIVDIQIIKKQKNFLEGKIIHVHHYSEDRVKPRCPHFGVCGGCKWQHLPYSYQLKFKQQQVVDALERIGKLSLPPMPDILPSSREYYYRNKLEFSFSSRPWLVHPHSEADGPIPDKALGFHIPGWFDKILDLETCFLQPEPSNSIRMAAREIALSQGLSFYDQREHSGFLRNLMVRNNQKGEFMVVVAFGSDQPGPRTLFMNELKSRFPEIHSLMYYINTKRNDSFFDLDMVPFAGADHLIESLGALKFRIGPKSFFQTNLAQALVLYETTLEFAELTGREVVYDLYTGTGTIANFVAGKALRVIGIETVAEAISDAIENSRLNQIDNTHFVVGNIEDVLRNEFFAEHGEPDVIILDPPRAGMHPKVIKTLLEHPVSRLVYVSCNPATQARDLALLSSRYVLKRIQPVDMFPHTHHVENVVLLEKTGE